MSRARSVLGSFGMAAASTADTHQARSRIRGIKRARDVRPSARSTAGNASGQSKRLVSSGMSSHQARRPALPSVQVKDRARLSLKPGLRCCEALARRTSHGLVQLTCSRDCGRDYPSQDGSSAQSAAKRSQRTRAQWASLAHTAPIPARFEQHVDTVAIEDVSP